MSVTPVDELTSRLPDPTTSFPEAAGVSQALHKAVLNGAIPRATVNLVQLRAGQIVRNTYQVISKTDQLRKSGVSEEYIAAVASWTDAPYFTEAERVALELVEACLNPNLTAERVPDELFQRAAALYDEKELWTLVFAIGQISFFIPVSLIAKPIPGRPYGKNYSS